MSRYFPEFGEILAATRELERLTTSVKVPVFYADTLPDFYEFAPTCELDGEMIADMSHAFEAPDKTLFHNSDCANMFALIVENEDSNIDNSFCRLELE